MMGPDKENGGRKKRGDVTSDDLTGAERTDRYGARYACVEMMYNQRMKINQAANL